MGGGVEGERLHKQNKGSTRGVHPLVNKNKHVMLDSDDQQLGLHLLKLLLLLLTISCNADISADRSTEEVRPNTRAGGNDNGDEQDNDGDNPTCSFKKQDSNEYYNFNFIKPQSNEHTQVFLEYFKRFNADLNKYHRRQRPSHCPPLDDVLVFADDTSDACDAQESDRHSDCPLYSTINIIEITDKPDGEGRMVGGFARRTTYKVSQSDGTIITRYWIQIFLDTSFIENHERNSSLAWTVFLHEVGHAFGLDHNASDKNDIMHPTASIDISYDYDAYFKKIYQVVTSANFR